jgi:hypothetical protein
VTSHRPNLYFFCKHFLFRPLSCFLLPSLPLPLPFLPHQTRKLQIIMGKGQRAKKEQASLITAAFLSTILKEIDRSLTPPPSLINSFSLSRKTQPGHSFSLSVSHYLLPLYLPLSSISRPNRAILRSLSHSHISPFLCVSHSA